MFVFELLGSFLLVCGLFFFVVGTIGLLRMPDVYTRMHATTKCDTLGLSLIMLGIVFGHGFNWLSLKLILIIIFIWVTTPTAAHAIARAAFDTHETTDSDIPFWREEGAEDSD